VLNASMGVKVWNDSPKQKNGCVAALVDGHWFANASG